MKRNFRVLLNVAKSLYSVQTIHSLQPRGSFSVQPNDFDINGKTIIHDSKPSNCCVYSFSVHPKSYKFIQNCIDVLESHNMNIILPDFLYEEFLPQYTDDNLFSFDPNSKDDLIQLEKVTDFGCLAGGDGTLLQYSSFFNQGEGNLPPIIGFRPSSSIGFLLPFTIGKEDPEEIINQYLNNESLILERTRLKVEMEESRKNNLEAIHCINDIFLTRKIECPVKLEVLIDEIPLISSLKGDGILLSTSTGSTGYNLSAGGAVQFPHIQDTIQITPLHNFVPLGLPSIVCSVGEKENVRIKVSESCRSPVSISFDALEGISEVMERGESVVITKSKFPLYSVMSTESTIIEEWMNKFNKKLSDCIHTVHF